MQIDFKKILDKYHCNPALIWPESRLTYAEYFGKIEQVEQLLETMGIAKSNRIAINSPIHHHFPILFFALLKREAIVVPLSLKYPFRKIDELTQEIKCDQMIEVNQQDKKLSQLNIRILSSEKLISGSEKRMIKNSNTTLSLEQDATIIFTSGSLGKPKAILHSLGNHFYSALGSNMNIKLTPEDRWLICLPFYHIAGIAILFRTLIGGAASVIAAADNDVSKQIQDMKITHVSVVPTQLRRLLSNENAAETFKSLKAILVGGERVPPDLIRRALDMGLPVRTSYGSTEMCSQITTTTAGGLKQNLISSGKLLPERELKIEAGEKILVSGKTLCQGIVSASGIEEVRDQNGWYNTGDLGYLDQNSNLIIKGRQDNMFISGGENIYPEEIETEILNIDYITNVCVIDIVDQEFGARPAAFLKTEDENFLDLANLNSYLETRLPRYKIPVKYFRWPDEIDVMKPDRNRLKKIITGIKP
jgi:O-succinylbenzoic acid--CoA ligase